MALAGGWPGGWPTGGPASGAGCGAWTAPSPAGTCSPSGFRGQLADNPHIRFFESRLRGSTGCTVLRQRWYADLRVVNTVERPGAPVRTLARYVVETGRPGAEQV